MSESESETVAAASSEAEHEGPESPQGDAPLGPAGEKALAEGLVAVWHGVIYGPPPPASR